MESFKQGQQIITRSGKVPATDAEKSSPGFTNTNQITVRR